MLPADVAARPQWTEKLYPPSQGQDHLGLGSVSSDQILPKLSPGIVVQTVHPRYWSFYVSARRVLAARFAPHPPRFLTLL